MLRSAEHGRNRLTMLSPQLSPRGRVFGMVADVSKFEDVRRFIAGAHAEFGALHILVNNAGAGAFAHVAQLSPEAWDKMIALNLSGVHYCCHEIMPIFKHAGGGDVVNIGSLAGVNAFAGGAGYNASKFGLVGYSEAMMLDHRYDGVRVSLIMPGSVDTEFGSARRCRRTRADAWRIEARMGDRARGYRGYRGERIEDARQDHGQPGRSKAFPAAPENMNCMYTKRLAWHVPSEKA